MEIMVSVICTVYNHEKYLRKCLDGFVMQKTNFKFEVLIHDDASTDGSADIIREYEKKYPDIIKPIYQTENQYSKGIKVSQSLYPLIRGKYLAFCEGDDYWCDENKLQKQFDVMESNPDCSICVHRFENISEDGVSLKSYRPTYNFEKNIFNCEEYLNLIIKLGHPFQTSSYFIKMSLFDYKNKPDFWANSDVGDVPMILYCISRGNLYFVDEVMSCYRNNSVGSWTNSLLNNRSKLITQLNKMFDLYVSYDKYIDYKYSKQIQEIKNELLFKVSLYENNSKESLKKKYRPFFNKLSNKEKIFVVLNAYFPHIMKLYKKSKDKNNA
ncbi:glycosyltransferase [uncultured Eubacterium sp.]|uniref:glycosyltransferase family 2 protein n=1 Tax=uncultured Eubacterium sp. TaxID=165185 RepID=UPI0015A9D261|nr:glycosyltransferase [uncultured Eubacterium sp.]